MKRMTLFILAIAALPSCQSPADTARLGSLADIAITYSQRKGVLTDADVEALRNASAIILPPVTVETTSGK